MDFSKVAVILARPAESRNIGSVCRAMANCDMSDLRIVGTKKSDIDEEAVKRLAIHAAPIFENAKFFDSIKEAAFDCVFAAGTTRRTGLKRKGTLLLPEDLAKMVVNAASSQGENSHAAIVFGNEKSGLSSEEVEECDFAVTIPSSESFGSLNLSHAVQVVCYEIFRAGLKNSENSDSGQNRNVREALSRGELKQTVEFILEDLAQIGFFSHTGRENMQKLWDEVLSRAALSKDEALLIQKTFDRAAVMATHKALNHPDAFRAYKI